MFNLASKKTASLLLLGVIFIGAACTPPTVERSGESAPVAEAVEAETVETEDGIVSPSEPSEPSGSEGGEFAAALPVSEESIDGVPVGFTEDGHAYYGDPNAPVVIEEYSDYQCPFCSRFVSETMSLIKDEAIANGEAVIIFYDYPLPIHPQGIPAAEAARCAGENGAVAYWEMHDALFESGPRWGISDPDPVFVAMAEELGLDAAEFEKCLSEDRYVPAVEADLAQGQRLGVTGTPTFFLNGEALVGALPIQVFRSAIATVLSGESIAQAEPETPPLPDVDDLDIPPFEMPDPLVVEEDFAAVMGDADAPILIVEYTDYQCPFCARHALSTMPIVLQQMIDTGRVRYALKDFPLDSLHPLARVSAVAARCAGEQDAYWEMHDELFVQQEFWAVSPDVNQFFTEMAADLGLDEGDFTTCLNSGQYDEAIQANFAEGSSFGITGTPAFVIGGYSISGAQPFDIFDLVVTNLEDGTIEELFRAAYDDQVAAYREQVARERAAQLPVDVPIEESFSIGEPNAPVVVVEYTDFQCPYCGRHFAQTFPRLKEEYIDKGLVRYVFKDFPLDFHLQAGRASEAARCANEQDAFLEMHSALFERQGEWSGQDNVDELFVSYAADLNLDQEAFTTCLESGKYAELVQADLAEGTSFGINGTPTFFVNGTRLVGAVPFENFVQLIESQLNAE
ncbi:MAG: thioredoxin domain-containing protein [Ardenticatenaceae bacterium]|nr:thioredoxin domain-containing protein [Ardenticatenaceae bacterium]